MNFSFGPLNSAALSTDHENGRAMKMPAWVQSQSDYSTVESENERRVIKPKFREGFCAWGGGFAQ